MGKLEAAMPLHKRRRRYRETHRKHTGSTQRPSETKSEREGDVVGKS